ncbi:unnamed protein product, partial [Prorocentrum cordatum]
MPAMASAKERLVEGLRRLDPGGTGRLPRPVFEGVMRNVCRASPAGPESLDLALARAGVGDDVRYEDFLAWVYEESAEEQPSAATTHSQNAELSECVEAAKQKLDSEAGVAPGQETWTTQKWLGTSLTSPIVADALNSPIAPDTDPALQLLFMKSLAEKGNRDMVLDLLRSKAVLESMADKIWGELQVLKDATAVTAEELNGKFAQDAKFTMAFGGLNVFYGGLEALIGSPSARVLEAMVHEHCEEKDSSKEFTTGNYGVTTTSKAEWLFVANPEGGPEQVGLQQWPREQKLVDSGDIAKCRQVRTSAELDFILKDLNSKLKNAEQATLMREEMVGGVLYTGPLFVKYNAVNRGGAINVEQGDYAKKQFQKTCLGNRYVTTIHAINSCLLKLSKLQKAVTVYRGFSGGVLPKEFWEENRDGVRGGIEFGFMSTTVEKQVALSYAQGGVSTVLEIQMGMVDRGADLSVLSQYPHEREICFAPLTGIEIVSGRVEASVLIVQTRLSVNLTALTIEQVIAKRKRVMEEMLENLKREVVQSLAGVSWQALFNELGEGKAFQLLVEQHACDELDRAFTASAEKDFNKDDVFQNAVRAFLGVSGAVQHQQADLLEVLADKSHGATAAKLQERAAVFRDDEMVMQARSRARSLAGRARAPSRLRGRPGPMTEQHSWFWVVISPNPRCDILHAPRSPASLPPSSGSR